ncbi:FixH family protein [Brumimicrobium oceani]|uniref:YtkA-like domain-containing protein n=1 Tax=Brumimicrobium oceani TaxID=2100725 RepID=A0A2U2XDD5_9FLAO|nr:FixH family protein [Brumimicrobium oceani]PWH85777.1 hypothetical protein DIT68_06700 [Brumimicrobium oceani]
MKKIFLLSLMSAFLFVSCDKEDDNMDDPITGGTSSQSQYKLIDKDTTDNDLIVELYAKTETIEMGYTPLYVKVKDLGGSAVENAMVSFMPMMDMGTMQHSSPLEQPVFNSSSKYYEGMVVFTMASSMGDWELDVIANGEAASFDINVMMNPTGTKYVGSYNGTDGEKYIVTLVRPFDWQVGMNDVSFMVHKKETMMSFPAVNDFTIAMDPQMTSMGHGSPNNVSPVSVGNGYYDGKANFTMTGDWRLNLDLIKAGDTIVNAYIDVLF